jgi:hypothetical protein
MLDGTLKPLHIHQAVGCLTIAKKLLGAAHGCVVADQMGMGKTLQLFGLLRLFFEVAAQYQDVSNDKSRRPLDKRHLRDACRNTIDL